MRAFTRSKKTFGVRVVVTVILIINLASCRTYNMYEFDPLEQALFSGRLFVALDGTYLPNYELDGKKFADYRHPYLLKINFVVSSSEGLDAFKVKNLVLRGEESATVFSLGDWAVEDLKRIDSEGAVRAPIGIEDFLPDGHPHESLILSGTFVAEYKNGKTDERTLSLLLKSKFRTSKRWDWWDKLMSV